MGKGMPPPRRHRAKVAVAERAVAESADAAGAQAAEPGRVALDGVEVVQVVQDMAHTVALIAAKPAVVRVYLSRPAGGPLVLRGDISVRVTAGGPAQIVPSLDTVRVAASQNGQLRRKREDLRLSLNFLLPPSLTAPGRRFISVAALTDAGSGEQVACQNCDGQVLRVTFVESPPLRVRLVKFSYRGDDPPGRHVPGARDSSLFKSWLARAYPVSSVNFSEHVVEANFGPPFDTDEENGTCNLANAQLAAIRNLDIDGGADQRTHYYGMVADGGGFMRGCANSIPDRPDPTAVASGPTGPQGYAWDTDGSYGDWYGGHELAHTFGRLHPGFCNGNSGDDPDYPFPKGQLSKNDGAFVGFDVGDPALGLPMKALPGARWHDVMTYCARQWMSSYTYEGIRRRLLAEGALGATPSVAGAQAEAEALSAASALEVSMASGDFINVVGTVNLTRKTGKLLYVNPVSKALAAAGAADDRVQLRVKSADGQTLQQHPLPFKADTCRDKGKDRTGIVDAFIPAHPQARALELVIEGQVVDTYRAGGALPDATNLHAAEATAEAVSLAWEGAPGKAGNISYNVQASADEGQTWQTVAVGRVSPDVKIDLNQFPPGSSITVRVIATDGFTSKVVASGPLPVEEAGE